MKQLLLSVQIFLCSLFLFKVTQAQGNVIDSLRLVLKTAHEDTSKVNLLNRLSIAYNNYNDFDNALKCANLALKSARKINYVKGTIMSLDNIGNAYDDHGNNKEALNMFTIALNIKREIGNKKDIAYSHNVIGIVNYELGNYSEALKNYVAALKLNIEINNKKGIAKNHNNIGAVFFSQGDYSKALDNYYASLKVAEELGDEKEIANDHLNIGLSYWRQGNYTEALKSELIALKINEKLGNKSGIAGNYTSIGLINYEQGNYSEALKSLLYSLKINEALGDKTEIANDNTNIGLVYYEQGKYAEALKNQTMSLTLHTEIGDKNGMAFNLSNIGLIYFKKGDNEEALKNYYAALKINLENDDKGEMANSYINIGDVYIKQKRYLEAKLVIEKSLALAKEIGNKTKIKESCFAMAVLDSAQGSWKNAYDHFKTYLVYRDSLINEANTKKLIQSQMQYEFDKKQTEEKIKQENKDAIVSLEKRRQQVVTLSIGIGLVVLLLFSIILFNRFRLTLKQKQVIEVQKKEVEIQKELVEEKNKQVTDSINYAKRIQQAILPSTKIIKQFLPNSFVLYIPKDIVAGDFYWIEKKGNSVLFAACDCTGHGVPGAMVSVVCYNALNRAVREFRMGQPAAILDITAQMVIENFSDSEDEIKDGMDICLCSYNADNKMLEYAGANNPLWLLRNGEIAETKADKQPIGVYENNHPFTNHQLQLQTDDIIYLFSDGFADQFGGETGRKKLTRKRFKEFLLSIKAEEMEEQGRRIKSFFYQYKGSVEQIDDILVMGFKV